MDIEGFVSGIDLFDLLAMLFLGSMFILGFIQGAIRRLLGLASIVFSFLLAAQLREPFGDYLARNWVGLAPQYDAMVAFATVFVAASVIFAIVIQSFYREVTLFAEKPAIDEVIGGVLGVIEGLVILGAVIIILDSFFRIPGIPETRNEFGAFRNLFNAYDHSGTAELFRSNLVPLFFALIGGLVPESVRAVFPSAN